MSAFRRKWVSEKYMVCMVCMVCGWSVVSDKVTYWAVWGQLKSNRWKNFSSDTTSGILLVEPNKPSSSGESQHRKAWGWGTFIQMWSPCITRSHIWYLWQWLAVEEPLCPSRRAIKKAHIQKPWEMILFWFNKYCIKYFQATSLSIWWFTPRFDHQSKWI